MSAVTLSAALLAFAFLGSFVRYMGDDWCTAAVINKHGLWGAQWRWYVGWTGRYSFSLASGIAHLPGPRAASLIPALMLMLWLVAAFWAAYQIALAARWPRPLVASLLAAEFVVFVTLNTAHNIVQSFYWQTGVLTYVAPLILLTFYVGLVVHRARVQSVGPVAWGLSALSLATTFAAGGFSETYAVMQAGGLLLAAAACMKGARASSGRALRPLVLSGLAGSALALLVVALAPGNSVRQGFFPPQSLVTTAKLSLYYATGHVPYTAYLAPCTTLLTLAAPALAGFYLHMIEPGRRESLDPRATRRLLVLLPAAGYFLIVCCYAPAAYGMSTYLPGRARLIPQFVFVCVAITFAYMAGALLAGYASARGRTTSAVATVGAGVVAALLVLSPVSAAWRVLTLIKGARESAYVFDQMDREIRAAKEQGVMDQTVRAVGDVESRFGAGKTELQIERDPEDWKNKCMARFYGINSVRSQ
ncbi:MAG: DUF6056 family protein [Pyrinomonadaceae bacterium]